jgi:hypothetical protein
MKIIETIPIEHDCYNCNQQGYNVRYGWTLQNFVLSVINFFTEMEFVPKRKCEICKGTGFVLIKYLQFKR